MRVTTPTSSPAPARATGTAPAGSVLRVHKEFSTPTSPVLQPDGTVGDPLTYPDVLDTTYR